MCLPVCVCARSICLCGSVRKCVLRASPLVRRPQRNSDKVKVPVTQQCLTGQRLEVQCEGPWGGPGDCDKGQVVLQLIVCPSLSCLGLSHPEG